MLAIVLDEDQHSQKVLALLLRKLGYTQILAAQDIDELDFQSRQNLNRVRLILSAYSLEDGLDIPLSRIILKNSALNLAPLILMTNSKLQFSLNVNRSRFSRIDSYLHRPFGIEALKDALSEAHLRRARFRNVILIYGKDTPEAIEATFVEKNDSHWKEAIFVQSFAELKNKYETYGFKIGGILFDPNWAKDVQIGPWLTHIRKENLGSALVIGTLSQEPREIQEFRIHSDFFFDPALSWETLLLNMSERLQYDWRVKNWIRRAKIEIKNGNPKDLEKLFKKALTLKITHWEILELQGLLATFRNDLELARELYFRALEMNPCAPSTYIQLFQISAFTKKDFHVAQALEYCPNHPQIKSLVERMSS